jgi:hypothetical protein
MKFTKTSILVSTVILALGVAISWQDHRQLNSARLNQRQLAVKLAAVGNRADFSQAGKDGEITKPHRDKREGNHHESTSELITLIQEITADSNYSSNSDPASSAKRQSLGTRLQSLDAAQWRALLSGIQAGQVFKEFGDTNIMHSALLGLMGLYFRDSGQPQTLLTLAKQSPLLFKDNKEGLVGMETCMALWAKEDPTSAVAWIRENHLNFPGLVNRGRISGEMLSHVAMKNPALAFQLIGELGIEKPNNSISSIALFAESPESRTAIFAALRRYVSTMPAGEDRDQALNIGVEHLILGAGLQGFEAGAEWINHAGIMPEQFAYMFDKMAEKGGGFESDRRLFDLLIPRLPQEKVAGSVSKLVTSWAKQDHKSAGEWISGQANGVVKNAGIGAYSYEVAAYEPAVAVQWAMTLPAGENREKALQGVYENWLKTDPSGKEAFGKQHGFE